nr:PREDICTED: uncharacterized protein LOC109037096 [Bemisia tabaci]
MNRCRFILNTNFLFYQAAWRGSLCPDNKTALFPEFTPFFREKGHSKWQNIRHQKAANDLQKSRTFNMLILQIKRAILDGGSNNPEHNSALANVVASCKRANMPASTIQSALQGSKDKPLTSAWFEMKGPKGSILYISVMSHHVPILKQTIKSLVKRTKCPVEFTERMAKGIFEHKGIIVAEPPPDVKNIEEISMDHAIEIGAEEVDPIEDTNLLEFVTAASSLYKARMALEEKKYVIKEAELVYIPRVIAELDDEEAKLLQALQDEIEKLPEIVQIFRNF